MRLLLLIAALALAGCEPETARRQTFLNGCHEQGFTSGQCDFLWQKGRAR